MTKSETIQAEAREHLNRLVKPGDTIHTILRHRTSSGMRRSISLVKLVDNEAIDLDYWAARLLGERIDQDRGGIKVSGCGMDMGYHLVYALSRCLFPMGFHHVTDRCPSNDHHNHPRESFDHHKDGGYALRHQWL